jgi:hypothetical protein
MNKFYNLNFLNQNKIQNRKKCCKRKTEMKINKNRGKNKKWADQAGPYRAVTADLVGV